MQFLSIISDSFRESRDQKIFWVMIALSLLVAAAMSCIGFKPGEVDFFFGAWTIETQHFTGPMGLRQDLIATLLVDGILDNTLGTLGMVLAIIATASFIPTFMERGVIDVYLSKPISRPALFLAKYLGSMVFILVQATVFVGLTLLVAGLRWHVWLPRYLLVIPLIVVLFSYLYCVSAFIGVQYRSAMVSVLISLAAWFVFFGIQTADDFFEMGGLSSLRALSEDSQSHSVGGRESETQAKADPNIWEHLFHVARWVIPKTQDITYLSRRIMKGAQAMDLMPAPEPGNQAATNRARDVEAKRLSIPAWQTLGSSLLFEAVLVLAAMWKFSRTDF